MLRGKLAVIAVALVGLATTLVAQPSGPHFAGDLAVQVLPGPQMPLPGAPVNTVPYPKCPEGFHLAQRGADVFRCRKVVSMRDFLPALQAAESAPCAPRGYWNVGPDIYQTAHEGGIAVIFLCGHAK